MSLLQYYVPDVMLQSLQEMDLQALKDKGIQGIAFDIDNTLVPHGKEATPEAISFIHQLSENGFLVCLLSNNHEERVTPFAKAVSCYGVWDAGKPLKKAFDRAAACMGISLQKMAFVGDQLFTDVYGSRRAGCWTVFVKPLDKTTDPPFVSLKRILEKPLFFYIKRQRQRKNA